jgi:N-acetylneuraminic acid mutarotase
MKKKRAAQSGLFSLRAIPALLFCTAAICSMLVTETLPAFFRSGTATKTSERTLTFAQRVAYQRAIEEVYGRHRIWPKARPDPKPSLDRVMSQAQLETKVSDYLDKSQTLQDYLQQPITSERLQAEMNRMAQHTKQPEVLRELFEALGNDPFVIAECLARPVLAERLFKSAPVCQTSWTRSQLVPSCKTHGLEFGSYTLPLIATTLQTEGTCNDAWAATTTANAPTAREWHTAVWTGAEMIVWGGWDSANYLDTGGRYNPSTDSWTATSVTNAPAARARHTAVWTGTEMIVWGGIDPDYLNTGGRYNPVTDSWVSTSTTNAPSARLFHAAVWTGTEMIVWGGKDVSELPSNTGGRYNPSSNSWTATSTTNAPAARFYHTAVWTGSEMIIWGGKDFSSAFNTGGRYSPITDTWAATNTTDAPAARYVHTAVWTGGKMVVWGGYNGCNLDTGGGYDPGTDTWVATSTRDAPTARESHTAIWAATEMIVWGGYDGFNNVNTGARYNPAANTWTVASTINAPAARDEHTAVWTGDEMIVWGGIDAIGLTNTGGRYCDQHPIARLTPSRTPRPTPSSIVSSVPTSTRTTTAAAASTPCTPVLLLIETFDNVTPPQLPPGWIAINAIDPDGVPWMTSNSGGPLPPADSPPNAAFVNEPNAISDKRLQSPSIFLSEGPEAVQITFSNNFNLQAGFDGGVLEISIDGGATFQDILARGTFISGGYNGMISVCSDNPLAGRQAWTGNSAGFITTTVSLPVVTWGPEMILRWRMVSDSTVFGEGWRVDTLIVSQCQQTPTPTATPSTAPTATSTSTPRVTPTPRVAPTPRPRPTPAQHPMPR